MLQRGLGGPAGDFVEPYVLAHEYGHHIQNLLGTMGRVRTQQGPESDAVRLELQADCYAGMWTGSATSTDDGSGEPLISELDQQDIDEAIAAAKAVGDDRIQDRTTGRVNPREWTHGSAEQRQRWFMIGYEEGRLEACDTFSASSAPCEPRLPQGLPAAGQSSSSASSCGYCRCSARRWGATAGWRNFETSAPSPPATRSSAHSARLSAV